MQSNSSLAIRVGIFFTIALILIMGLSLQVGHGGLFANTYEVIANFRQAHGIDSGTRVTLRGVPVGSVKSMDWNPRIFRVQVIMEIEDKYQIPQNSVAKIQVSSLLGGNVVNITVPEGPEEFAALEHGDSIETIDTPSMDEIIETVGNLSEDTQNLVRNLDRNQQETMSRINAVIDENRAYIRETSESFSRTGPRLEELSERLNEMTEFVQSGQGTLGRLYADPELYDDMRSLSDQANEIAQQIRSGEGSLGALIYDDAIANDARDIMADLQRAAREVEAAIAENREGLRSLVSALSDAGPRIDQAIENFKEVSRKVNEGDGTLGRLVNDPKLYEDAQRAVNQVGESFEAGEEQGVFRSFLGLIFGALI